VITTEDRDGIAVLRMDDGKANAIQGRFLADFNRALDAASGADGVVLTGARKIFSAGLDLPALIDLPRAAIAALMEDFHDTMLRMFLWPSAVVCAVNGHAVAGGCILAMQADRRIMADGEAKIGVNEVQLRLALPAVVVETFRAQLTPRSLSLVCLEGGLFSALEAKDAGLVDEVAPAELLDACASDLARRLASVGRPAYAEVKRILRRPAAEALEGARKADAKIWLDLWFSDASRQRIEAVVAKLKSR
jgi:enoyl-CoA hydratase